MLFNRVTNAAAEIRSQLDLTDLVRILYRRRRLVIGTIVVLTGLAAAAAFLLPGYYTATATLVVEGRDPNVIKAEAVVQAGEQDTQTLQTHVQMLDSHFFMQQIVTQLGLDHDPEFTDMRPLPVRVLATAAQMLPPQWLVTVGLADSIKPPAASRNPAVPTPAAQAVLTKFATDQLMMRTLIEQIGNSYVVSIKVGSYDAQKAARIANAIVQSYIDKQRDFKREATVRAADWLSQRVVSLRGDVSRAEKAVAAYKHQTGYIENRQDNPILRQLDQLSLQLVAAQSDRAQAEAKLAQIQSMLRSGRGIEDAAKVVTSELLVQFRQTEADLNRQIADLSKQYGPRHPQLVGVLAAVSSVRERESDEVQRIISDLSNQVTVARAREDQLRNEISKLNLAATGQENTALPLLELQREADSSDTLYKAFLGRLKELQEELQIVEPGVQLVSQASPPILPTFPNPILFIGAGFVGSTMLGTLLGFTAEMFDRSMRTASQLERILGLPSLALVPEIKRRRKRRPFFAQLRDEPHSLFAEAIRSVRMELLLSDVDRPPRTVLMTSSLPGEGKTTLSTSLAAVVAQHGQRTIVVDLDLHRPWLHKLVSHGGDRADIVTYLTDGCSLDDLIHIDPDDPNLHFITIRRTPANPSALLGSQKMRTLLRELSARYEFVVLDLPPILAVNDARIIAPLVDAVLFVVEWGRTKEDAARSGIELLKDRNIKLAGAILNHVDVRRHAKLAYGDAIQYYGRYTKYYRRAA